MKLHQALKKNLLSWRQPWLANQPPLPHPLLSPFHPHSPLSRSLLSPLLGWCWLLAWALDPAAPAPAKVLPHSALITASDEGRGRNPTQLLRLQCNLPPLHAPDKRPGKIRLLEEFYSSLTTCSRVSFLSVTAGPGSETRCVPVLFGPDPVQYWLLYFITELKLQPAQTCLRLAGASPWWWSGKSWHQKNWAYPGTCCNRCLWWPWCFVWRNPVVWPDCG